MTTDPHRPSSRASCGTRIVVGCVSLVLVAAVVVGQLIWLPYYQEQRIISEIRELGGKVRLETFDTFGLQPYLTANQSKIFDRATEVWCSNSEITDAGVQRVSGLKKLKRLGLSDTSITDSGLVHLRRMHDLESLYVDGTRISDSGLAQLAGLTKLKRLSLTETAVSERGLTCLSGLKDLEFLWLKRTKVSDAGLATVKAIFPDCQISR
jgi:hypothetical protein